MRSKPIVVIGATGQQGRPAIEALHARGWPVRALTRDAQSARARGLMGMGAELAVGDLTDRTSVEAALAGAHGVFCVAPLLGSFTPPASLERQLQCVRTAIDAAAAAGIAHFVLSSASGADKPVNANRRNKQLMEIHLRSTPMLATVLRPVSLMDNFLLPDWGLHEDGFSTALTPATRQQVVAAADIGALAAIAFDRPGDFPGGVMEIAGDDLTPIEMAQALSRVLGRAIPYRRIEVETLAATNPGMAEGYRRLNAGERTEIDIGAVRALHPGLMSFETWLRDIGARVLAPILPTVGPSHQPL